MYEPFIAESALMQGDIVDHCPIARLDEHSDATDPDFIIYRARAIVLTQACDLAQTGRTNKVLVAAVSESRSLVEKGLLNPRVIRDNIRRHQTFGWYFLPSSAAPVAFPESIVDLREVHTVDRRILERLISEGMGVCRLATPYREHMAQHFGVTYMRIGLPAAYESEP